MNGPRLFWPLALALLAGTTITAALTYQHLALLVVGCIIGAFDVLLVGDWLAYRAGRRFYELRRALAITPESELASHLRSLPLEAILEVLRRKPEALNGETQGGLWWLLVDDQRVPLPFLDEYAAQAEGDFLPPVRSWSDGPRRDWARALTTDLVECGLAVPGNGNRSARLAPGKSWADAWRHWGMAGVPGID